MFTLLVFVCVYEITQSVVRGIQCSYGW